MEGVAFPLQVSGCRFDDIDSCSCGCDGMRLELFGLKHAESVGEADTVIHFVCPFDADRLVMLVFVFASSIVVSRNVGKDGGVKTVC